MKKLIVIFLVILLGCKKEIISYPPDNLEIIFNKPHLHYPMQMVCGWPQNTDSLPKGYKYKRIYDKVSVDKFLNLYGKYKVATTNFGVDVRIYILVHQGIKTDTLCLGENFGVMLNGHSMEDSKELLSFIKQKIEFEGKQISD